MKRLKYLIALMPLIVALMFVSSCNKEEGVHGPGQQDPAVKGKILDIVKHLPKIASEKRLHRSPGTGTRDGGWSFADPGDGFSFSSSNGVFVYSEATNTLVFQPSASTSASAGGTVVAGETSLDVNYAFCFSSDNGDNALGADLFSSTNASTSGVSGVIGVSGDFDELQNADSTTEFTDIFHGLAFYFVYDGSPSGNYDVVDWQNVSWPCEQCAAT